MEIQGASHATPEEVAARLSSVFEENREWLTRPQFKNRAARTALLEQVRRLRYRFDEKRPFRLPTIEPLLADGCGDCKALTGAWHTLLETLLGPQWAIETILGPGGQPNMFHAAMRLRRGRGPWQPFDPSVDGGMPPPPLDVYAHPESVIVATRRVGPF